MPYFNGQLHGWNSPKGYIAPTPVTKVYCDDCAAVAIPFPENATAGRGHWDTDFRWCGIYGGNRLCDCCNKPVDKRKGFL